MASYQRTVAPATEPITLAEAKLFAKIDDTTDNDLVTALIVAAREYVEGNIWRPLITQTWVYWLDASELTDAVILLNKAPISAVSSVQYYDSADVLQTLDSTNYEYDLYSNPVRFRLKSVPNCYDKMNALKITFVAGYGSASAVPQRIKQAMYLIINTMYENRVEEITGTITSKFDLTAERLLYPYRNNLINA